MGMSSRGASAGKGAVAQQQQRKRRKGGNRKGGSRASDEAAAPAAAAYQYQSFTEEDSDSDGEDVLAALKDYSDKTPEIGDEIAVKCPADPPYPEGWYTGVCIGITEHDDGVVAKKRSKRRGFTLKVEWDGGGEEELVNPEWRMKSEAPDKQGRVSHRDTKLRPYMKYWVTRLNAMNEAEKKLSRTRAGKTVRADPDQQVEWVQCCNPSCGKWRSLPPYLKPSAVLDSCDRKWYCVLNSWDEAIASCGAAQESGYMSKTSST